MLLHKLEGLLGISLPLDQIPHHAQPPRLMRPGHLARLFDPPAGIPASQAEKTDQHPHPLNAALGQHRLRPADAVGTDPAHLGQQGIRSPLDTGDLLRSQVSRLRAEAARFLADMQSDLPPLLIEHAHHPAIPANPHPPAEVFRGNRVVGFLHFHMRVPMHHPFRLLEQGKAVDRQRVQGGSFGLLEKGSHLFAGSTVDASVRYSAFPVTQVSVLFFQAGEAASLQCVVFDIGDASFHFTFVAGRSGFGGQQYRAIVLAERLNLGIEFGIEPVGLRHGGLQVVDDESTGYATEVEKRVLDTANKRFGALPINHFAVAFA